MFDSSAEEGKKRQRGQVLSSKSYFLIGLSGKNDSIHTIFYWKVKISTCLEDFSAYEKVREEATQIYTEAYSGRRASKCRGHEQEGRPACSRCESSVLQERSKQGLNGRRWG